MRILTFSRLVGIAAIGVAYVHGKRGGDASFDSISDTLRYMWSSASERIAGTTTSRDRSVMPERRVNPKMAPNGLSGDRPPRPQGGGAV